MTFQSPQPLSACPPAIADLVARGRWPTGPLQIWREHSSGWSAALPRGEEEIVLHAPPFLTIAQREAAGEGFWSRSEAAPEGIDPAKSLLIGDFGLGSDAPIVLDYRSGAPPPRVLRLEWRQPAAHNRWVELAPSLPDLLRMLGL